MRKNSASLSAFFVGELVLIESPFKVLEMTQVFQHNLIKICFKPSLFFFRPLKSENETSFTGEFSPGHFVNLKEAKNNNDEFFLHLVEQHYKDVVANPHTARKCTSAR